MQVLRLVILYHAPESWIGRGEGDVANNVRSSESTQNDDVSPITLVFFVEEIYIYKQLNFTHILICTNMVDLKQHSSKSIDSVINNADIIRKYTERAVHFKCHTV